MKASAKPGHPALEWGLCLLFCLCFSAGGGVTVLCMASCAALAAPPVRARLPGLNKGWIPAVVLLFAIGCAASPAAAAFYGTGAAVWSETGASSAAPDEDAEDAGTLEAGQDGGSVTVYITKTGSKYHRGDCSALKSSKIEITLAEALAQGYEPCKLCDPPS